MTTSGHRFRDAVNDVLAAVRVTAFLCAGVFFAAFVYFAAHGDWGFAARGAFGAVVLGATAVWGLRQITDADMDQDD